MYSSKTSQQLLSKAKILRVKYLKIKPKSFSEKEKIELINRVTYHSSKIEGLELNYGDTMNFLKKGLIRKGSRLKDIADLKNHKEVLMTIFNTYDELTLSDDTIRKLHKQLMNDDIQWDNKDVYNDTAGIYKQSDNFGVREVGVFKEYMQWPLVPKAIKKLCKETSEAIELENTLPAIINFHYQFANEIHPFWDGNGRMARLLTNLLLLKNEFPLINIEHNRKRQYINSLIKQERTPEFNDFHNFMLKIINNTMSAQIDNYKAY